MKVWIVHGYFLTGTGSNLYVQNLAKQLCSMGHDVTLFCQDKEFAKQPYIGSGYIFDRDNQSAELTHTKETPYTGKGRCFVPNIGGVLPVYVKDFYEGYKAEEIPKMSEGDLEHYIGCNVKALKSCLLEEKPDMIISNHCVMQPAYVKRALEGEEDIFSLTIIHGSALNFTVKKSDRAFQYALEGLEAADGLIFLTQHSKDELKNAFQGRADLKAKRILIPAGVDIKNFIPIKDGENKFDRVKILLKNIESDEDLAMDPDYAENEREIERLIKSSTASQLASNKEKLMEKGGKKYIDFDVKEKLERIDWNREKIILFYGKYLWTKGIHNIILALPLVLAKKPDSRLIMVGYGTSRGYLEALIHALDSGNLENLKYLLTHPKEFQNCVEEGTEIYSQWMIDKLEDPELMKKYLALAKGKLAERVVFTGFMDHSILKDMIPCADVAIAPSIFPEAFGLVGVEALACGVLPLQTYHSGFRYVVDTYAELFDLDERFKKLDKLWLREDLIENIANNINAVFEAYGDRGPELVNLVRDRARQICLDNYSWDSVVDHFIHEAEEFHNHKPAK